MTTLSPVKAAQLANEVYAVQRDSEVRFFLDNPLFKGKENGTATVHKHLKAEVGGRILLNHEDGFGICVKGGENNKGEIFLIFRGTTMANKKADVLTDARIGLTRSNTGQLVHCGFQHCFSSMLPAIRSFFTSFKGNIKTVHCIGHSLGGAVAALAADWVAKTLKHPTKLYTFGAPRLGTEFFVKSTTSAIGEANIHRVYHRTDPVPMVPLYPFMHAPFNGQGHYLYSAYPLTSGAAHFMANYITSVTGKSWQQMSDVPDQPYTIESAIESWLKSKSPVNTSSASFWRWVDSAIIYVIKKVAMTAILGLQATFIGAFTVADKIAYILAKGIDLADSVSIWVQRLMRKLMQALGMKIVEDKKELTRSLIQHVLTRLTEKANQEARDTLRKL
jgi:triacylglycerol lipase